MSDSPYIVDVTLENFSEVIIEGSRLQPVLVDFWAPWCQPCKALVPILEKLAVEYQGKFIVAKINTEEEQEIAMQFQIRSIPACKLFVDGTPVDEFSGALQEADIRTFLDKHIARESDSRIQEAQQLLLKGDADGAAQLIQDALNDNPSSTEAILAFAQLKAAIGEMEEAQKALDGLPVDEQQKPEVLMMRARMEFDVIAEKAPSIADLIRAVEEDENNSEARYQLSAQLVMHNKMQAALDQLLLLMQKDRAYGDDAARKAMIKIFNILGDDPMVPVYRSRMSNLLY